MQQNFLISANAFVQRAGIEALSKTGDAHVARMCATYDKRRKLMVELMREVTKEVKGATPGVDGGPSGRRSRVSRTLSLSRSEVETTATGRCARRGHNFGNPCRLRRR